MNTIDELGLYIIGWQIPDARQRSHRERASL
jgi:hypothetical protein